MQVHTLSSADAFVLRDLGSDVPALGIVRCAPKILVDGATWLARSITYACATFEVNAGGASAGVNAKPDDRGAAVAAFDGEVSAGAAGGHLVLDAGKGVLGIDGVDMPLLAAADPRSAAVREAAPALLAAGIVAAACSAVGSDVERRTFVIEGIDAFAPAAAVALVQAIAEAGGSIVGLSTAKASVIDPAGLAADLLVRAIELRDFGAVLGDAAPAANRLMGAEADVLLVGSKAGAVDHNAAAYVKARAVVPWGPVPVTAKALAVLRKSGVVVVPDFVSTAGPLLGWAGRSPVGTDAAAAGERVGAALAGVVDHDHGPLLGACLRAEAFLATWTDAQPFGRPLA